VGELRANLFGLFDVLGNVWEWCQDQDALETNYYQEFLNEPAINPSGPKSSVPGRVPRGGGYCDVPLAGRTAVRMVLDAKLSNGCLGFRVALPIDGQRTSAKKKSSLATSKTLTDLDFQKWMKHVGGLSASDQVTEVVAKLKKRNDGYDGEEKHVIERGVVTDLYLPAADITDLSPVRALPGLRRFGCNGSERAPGKLSDLSPVKGLSLNYLSCASTQVSDLSPLEGMPLAQVDFPATPVTDLMPLRNLPLHSIYCQLSRVADLTPLSGMRLSKLHLAGTQVSDLEPLRGMPLLYLYFDQTAVSDLSPLAGMNLRHLSFGGTQVRSLAVLKDTKLEALDCITAPVDDFSPLRDMPLTSLVCDFNVYRDAEVLRAMKSLGTINYQPAAEFWKDVEAKEAAMREWTKRVASMPAEAQVQAVVDRLKELNPGFDGPITHKTEDGVITGLEFASDQVSDISPVRALTQLRDLTCAGSAPGKGMLKDLWPLAGTPIMHLSVADTAVADLAALRKMKVVGLNLNGTRVTDLSPLAGTPIHSLYCRGTKVADLTPLSGSDLSFLDYVQTHVADIAPLQGVPLQNVLCSFRLERDAEVLGSIGALQTINGRPAADFLESARADRAAFAAWARQVAEMPVEEQVKAVAKKLRALNPDFDGNVKSQIRDGVVAELSVNCDNVDDISPVRALSGLPVLVCYGSAQDRGKLTDLWPLVGMQKLVHLNCTGTQVTDLSPVKYLNLTHLWCDATPVADLSPLARSSLISLSCAATQVRDLAPLAQTRLVSLGCFNNHITSLAPLKGLPLTHLTCHNNNITDLSPLKGMPLEILACDFSPLRDAEILRQIKTLKTINSKPAAELWKELSVGEK